MKELKRYKFLEEYPSQIGKDYFGEEYQAFDQDLGFGSGLMYLVYSDKVEIYTYNEGPYLLEKTAPSLEEALKLTSDWC